MATATTGNGWLKGISLCEVLIQGYDIQTCALGAHSIGESMQASNAGIKLSIIVPCYKVEKYLPKCLDSLMAQNLEDIEVICINDGSPDRCIDILNDYRDRFGSKIVVIDKKNEGVWKGRWDGIAVAQGEYIGFIDGDEGRLVELNTAPWNKCFRASVLKSMRNLTNPPTVLDDMAFHLLAYMDMHGRVVFTPKPLVHYMVREGSIINTVREEQIDSILAAFLEIKGYYEAARPQMLPMLDAMAFLHLGVSLTFRLSCDERYDVKAITDRFTAYLNQNFPTWSRSPYLESDYVKKNGGAFKKLRFAQKVYKAGLMSTALSVYRFMIEKMHIDIKW